MLLLTNVERNVVPLPSHFLLRRYFIDILNYTTGLYQVRTGWARYVFGSFLGGWGIYLYEYWCFLNLLNYGLSP